MSPAVSEQFLHWLLFLVSGSRHSGPPEANTELPECPELSLWAEATVQGSSPENPHCLHKPAVLI